MKKLLSVIILGSLIGCAATTPLVFDSGEYDHYVQVHQIAKFGVSSCSNPIIIRDQVLPKLDRSISDLLVYTQYKTNTGTSYKIAGAISDIITGMDKSYYYSGPNLPNATYCKFKLNEVQLGTERAMSAIGKEQ